MENKITNDLRDKLYEMIGQRAVRMLNMADILDETFNKVIPDRNPHEFREAFLKGYLFNE